MSFYDERILPWLIDRAMRQHQLRPYREQAIAAAAGRTLEIGVGSGLNLSLYGGAVASLCGIDPSLALLQLARRQCKSTGRGILLVAATAEQLPFPAGRFETVVSTWTLCSIPDPAKALAEIRRVLAPGGRFLFVEHGLAPEPAVARWQHWLTPGWRRVAGGCHLDRKIDDLISAAGFELRAGNTGYIRGPKPWTFLYRGQAVKPPPAVARRQAERHL
jgi:ubiquinone/menaquinone biosynthesis C-methylase UbiE